jgi:hypothetical protein
MSINVETIGGSTMVQHYVETLGQKDHLIPTPTFSRQPDGRRST